MRLLSRIYHSREILVAVILFCISLAVIYHEFGKYRYIEILVSIASIPFSALGFAALFTFLNFVALTGYDALALRYIRRPLPYHQTALASFVSNSFSHSLGFGIISGAPIRYRLYSSWGISTPEIVQIIIFCSVTVWLGFAAVSAVTFLLEPLVLPASLHAAWFSTKIFGIAFAVMLITYFIFSLLHSGKSVFGHRFNMPHASTVSVQLLVSVADWLSSAGVLYSVLPSAAMPSFAIFVEFYLIAQFAGTISQIPGGLGVFETVLLLLLHHTPSPRILGSLIAFRAIYYLLPLIIAAFLMGIHELTALSGIVRLQKLQEKLRSRRLLLL
ncbi:MAG TPA: lysylphosphatidylglycerol synthase domain-containing protein [Syntrophorhabdaceae bacterium]|nr:lysylphosphatidylglycerol synthase domain-containing protein [Syntrophorhabdaceae bacterium]